MWKGKRKKGEWTERVGVAESAQRGLNLVELVCMAAAVPAMATPA